MSAIVSGPNGREQDAVRFLSLLRLLMSHMNEDGSVGPKDASVGEQRRLTHQTISALLACGISTQAQVLQNALQWLISSEDPKRTDTVDYYVVPHKIEAAIEMDETGGHFCKEAMKHLLTRRVNPMHYDIPGETQNLFRTLWVLKILSMHPNASEYKDVTADSLRRLSDAHVGLTHRDLSLLISLYHRNIDEATLRSSPLREMIDDLASGQQQGLFDVKLDVEGRLQTLLNHGLSPEIVSGIEADVHYMLISTCYVVSNLSQLANRSNRIANITQQSVEALQKILPKDSKQIAEVFPEPYRQVMLTARSIIAFAASHPAGIASAILPYMIQEVVKNDLRTANEKKEREKERLRKVLRNWILVDWSDQDYQHLGGGFSGATVVRIQPKLMIPSDAEGRPIQASISNFDSVIIKYGQKNQLDEERKKYQAIPNAYRRYFAAIPDNSVEETVDGERIEYLVVEDLVNYSTLQEVLPAVRTDFRRYLAEQLIEFLSVVYTMPVLQGHTAAMVRTLYITPIFSSLGTIHEFFQRHESLGEADLDSLRNLDLLATKGWLFQDFPPCIMHGDLNLRNVLLQGAHHMGADLRFRMIDLDKFTRSGDLAYDIGEFIVDVEYVQARYKLRATVLELNEAVEKRFREFASDRGDESFDLRLQVAKARSLLKLVEIECKVGFQTTTATTETVGRLRRRINPFLHQAYRLLEDSVRRA